MTIRTREKNKYRREIRFFRPGVFSIPSVRASEQEKGRGGEKERRVFITGNLKTDLVGADTYIGRTRAHAHRGTLSSCANFERGAGSRGYCTNPRTVLVNKCSRKVLRFLQSVSARVSVPRVVSVPRSNSRHVEVERERKRKTAPKRTPRLDLESDRSSPPLKKRIDIKTSTRSYLLPRGLSEETFSKPHNEIRNERSMRN